MKFWQHSDLDRFGEIVDTINRDYPTLHLMIENNLVFVRGCLPIRDPNFEREIDFFSIEILFLPDYPKTVPIVRETDGRLEKIAKRHFNINGTACLFLRDARYKYFPLDATFAYFMDKIVVSFFIWQIEYDITDGNPSFKGLAHNTAGIMEYYFKFLNTSDIRVVRKFMEYVTVKKMRLHWKCHCSSGRLIRDCHKSFLLDMRKRLFNRKDIRFSLAQVNMWPQNAFGQ